MKVGDLVAYSSGQPGNDPGVKAALLVSWYKLGTRSELAEVIWLGTNRIEQIGAKYLKVINETR